MKRFFLIMVMVSAVSCSGVRMEERCDILIVPPSPLTRAEDPDECLISDYNLFIFNSFGILEEKRYVSVREHSGGNVHHVTTLLRDAPYSIFVAANIGYELPCNNMDDINEYRYHLAYPDEYSMGIPMAGRAENVAAGDDGVIVVPLERLMARVQLSVDRTLLPADASLGVERVTVGACPSSARLFRESKALSSDHLFNSGYTKTGLEVDALNRDVAPGISGTLNLYLLENCQGEVSAMESPRELELCSTLEIRITYRSQNFSTAPGKPVVYSFRLGEGEGNCDVRRNTSYTYTLKITEEGIRGL